MISKNCSPYPPEFRQQTIDLVLDGRTPEELAKNCGPRLLLADSRGSVPSFRKSAL